MPETLGVVTSPDPTFTFCKSYFNINSFLLKGFTRNGGMLKLELLRAMKKSAKMSGLENKILESSLWNFRIGGNYYWVLFHYYFEGLAFNQYVRKNT